MGLSLSIASLLLGMTMQTLQLSWDFETFQLTLFLSLITPGDGNATIATSLGLHSFSIECFPFWDLETVQFHSGGIARRICGNMRPHVTTV